MKDDTITTPEAAAELGVSVRRVHQLIAEGRLKARQAGRYWLVRRADLEAVRVRVRTGRPRKAAEPPRRKRRTPKGGLSA